MTNDIERLMTLELMDGLPNLLDFKRYAGLYASQDDVMSYYKKMSRTAFKQNGVNPDKAKDVFRMHTEHALLSYKERNPALFEASKNMSENNRYALSLMCINIMRATAAELNFKTNRVHRVLELNVIDDFLEAIGEEKLATVTSLKAIKERTDGNFMVMLARGIIMAIERNEMNTIDNFIVAAHHIKTIRASTTDKQDTLSGSFLFYMIHLIELRIGDRIMKVIAENPLSEKSTKAANALFAICSMLGSPAPMIAACKLEPTLFERHYSGILDENMVLADRLNIEQISPDVYTMGFVMMSASFATQKVASLVTKSPLDLFDIALHSELIQNAGANMLYAVSNMSGLMIPKAIETYQEQRSRFDDALNQIEQKLGLNLADKKEQIHQFDLLCQKMIANRELEAVKANFVNLVDEYGNAAAMLTNGLDALETDRQGLSESIAAVTTQMSNLFGDVGSARAKLDALYEQVETVKGDFIEGVVDLFQQFKSLHKDAERVCNDIDEQSALQTQSDDPSVAQDQTFSDLEQHLDDLTNENRKLKQELSRNRTRIAALEDSVKGRDASGTYPTENKVSAIEAAINKQKITPESALLIVSALRSNVDILPSAFESAKESADFGQSERLLQRLLTLTGEYHTAINNGTPDTEARKLFSGQEYAANESETTMSSTALRNERTFLINGERYEFEQHLRIGVANDKRKTIRVYFRIIDGRMVIAYCGRHKNLQ